MFIWVGNLSYEIAETGISSAFAGYGIVNRTHLATAW
jgi:RNA recognition motif-containing protein